jgi:uncharacterized protein
MVDLDLDVVRLRGDGQVLLVDRDEFVTHQVRYGYPADVVRQAEQAAAWLLARISASDEPFATDYLGWLEMITLTGPAEAEAGVGPAGEP